MCQVRACGNTSIRLAQPRTFIMLIGHMDCISPIAEMLSWVQCTPKARQMGATIHLTATAIQMRMAYYFPVSYNVQPCSKLQDLWISEKILNHLSPNEVGRAASFVLIVIHSIHIASCSSKGSIPLLTCSEKLGSLQMWQQYSEQIMSSKYIYIREK